MNPDLLSFLFDAYPEHRDGRVKYPSPSRPIRIDDRRDCDETPLFCHIQVTVPDPTSAVVHLELSNCPTNEEVKELIAEYGGKVVGTPPRTNVSLLITLTDVPFLRRFAKAVKGVVGRGQTYGTREWKFIAPRTGKSLQRLAGFLTTYRQSVKAQAPEVLKSVPDFAGPLEAPSRPKKKQPFQATPPPLPPEEDLFVIFAQLTRQHERPSHTAGQPG